MQSAAEQGLHGRRGRVVMLVDNGVNGDSRVQKQARSAAAAGWEVILLGLSPDDQTHTWQLGQAEVRLLPGKKYLGKRPYEYRRSLRYGPLGYPPNGFALYRLHRIKAWQADLRVRRAALTLAVRTRRPGRFSLARVLFKVRKDWLRAKARAARLALKWTVFRYTQQKNAKIRRRDLDGPWDRLVTLFWKIAKRERAWRWLEPRLWDYELAYGPTLDALTPDLIHANDFRMLGVGARATIRARAADRTVKLVWDAHEFLPGLHRGTHSVRWLPANVAHEREYAPYADAVVTVSPALAELLEFDHRLTRRPDVVLNAPEAILELPPDAGAGVVEAISDVRTACGLDASTPLLVYSGGIAPVRGVDIMVESLPKLPDVHVALVSVPPGKPTGRHIQTVLDLADRLGVRDRVHLLPYVAHWQVASFLSTADGAVSPLHHLANHEIALSNKFFEYAHARLPMVVSDVRTMAETTRQIGQGEVFRAQDVDDYVRAVVAVLAESDRYRAAYDEPGLIEGWTWEAQAKILDDVYTRLVPWVGSTGDAVREVSVIMTVNNAMPYLTKCIRSLLNQSIGMSRFEVIAVDGGSTDGGRERLERFSQLHPLTFTVTREPDSTSPAAAYNRGLEQASGRYILFLRAEDHLGPEALQRMVAAADADGADVLVPRTVGGNDPWPPAGGNDPWPPAGGNDPWPPTGGHGADREGIDLFDSQLAFSLSNHKLFRRELLERHHVRYLEDLTLGCDQPFTFEACLRAKRISVLDDYDHYYVVRRRDGRNIERPADLDLRLGSTARIIRFIADLVDPGPRRDAILYRYFSVELADLLGDEFLTLDRGQRERLCEGVGQLADDFLTEAISRRLETGLRLRYALAQRGHVDALATVIQQDVGPDGPRIVAEGDTYHLRYRCFRDEALSLPDSLFEVTGAVAESLARRLEVTAVSWDAEGDSSRGLTVTAHVPAQLTQFGPTPIRLTLGTVAGQVTLTADGDGSGTVARTQFRLADILRHSPAQGTRTDIRLALDLLEGCDVPVRLRSALSLPTHYTTRGYRVFRVKAVTGRDGQLAIDVAPVTARRVISRLRTELRGGRRRSATPA